MLWLITAVLLSYLLGSLSGSLLLGRLVGVDIRTRGSGNAGGTNAFRTLGWKFALGVALIDIGKGALAGWLGTRLHPAGAAIGPEALGLACVFAATLGHTWPVFFGFRGGKGAGTLVGGLLMLWPATVLPLLLVWLLVLSLSGFVGLATVCAGLALLAVAWLDSATTPNPPRLLFALTAAAFLLFTHRGNMARMWNRSEHRFERARVWARWWRRLQ